MTGRVQFLVLIMLSGLIIDKVAAHQLAITPPQPTSANPITLLATGEWPNGGAPSLQQWSRNGQTIRIDALGVLPGIPQPIIPYQLDVLIGQLPPGHYVVEYYVEVLAAPGPPPGTGPPAALPDASISFDVQTATGSGDTEPIPTFSLAAVVLLSVLLFSIATVHTRNGSLTTRRS